MALSIFFNKMHMIQLGRTPSPLYCIIDFLTHLLGHALVLIIFCAGGLGFIGYIKQTKAHPTVSVACSLASISVITILTKEGSLMTKRIDIQY
jgi:hypothetical protein